MKCFTLFATHFLEIPQHAKTIPKVQNLHVTAVMSNNIITPMYQMRKGPCDKSFGLECARVANFPLNVVEVR